MARLRIERTPTKSDPLHWEPLIAGERQEYEGYDVLLPDETLSSWSDRHQFVRLTSDDSAERDFGAIEIDLPGARGSLLNGLRLAATAPDAWLLRPNQRTLYCLKCLAEDRVRGLPFFMRRAWSVAWRTCCPQHGMLFDSDRRRMPPWHSELSTPIWTGAEIAIHLKRPFVTFLALGLNRSRRAIHLEAALGDEKQEGAWYPEGLDASSLRNTYRSIVTDLISQFYMDRDDAPEGLPNEEFNRQLNSNRFAINALAEAILSAWTNTPLPISASAQSTELLVRAVGWGKSIPTVVHRGQVLFRGPVKRTLPLTHYETILGSVRYQNVINPTERAQWGYFTLPEARRLGLDVNEAVHWLSQLTRNGQFLAFDAKAGRLKENSALSQNYRLQPGDADRYNLVLPSWAFGSPRPQTAQNVQDFVMFGPRSPEREQRRKSERRASMRNLIRPVRLQDALWDRTGSP